MQSPTLGIRSKRRTRRKQLSMAGLWIALTKEVRRGILVARYEVKA